jgi:eukaryotic-like serine/threonine-protein kinase
MDCAACGRENPDDARFCQACGVPIVPDTDDGASLVGKLIGGRYLVTRVIGEGGMGVVYEADQRMGGHNRKVAIKTLLPSLSADHTIVSRFFRESGIVAQLEHPNTIRFYDFGETSDKQLYIAMEFVKGEPLTDEIARGPMSTARVKRILKQVCGALAEAHALGIIHRDLKPDNIILTRRAGEEDFVKVLDFGIAKTTGPAANNKTKLTQQGVVLGTPPYMSPEQLAGQEIDLRSDVYSLGIIAYEMLTGSLPFQGDTPWQWATQHMTVAPPAMATVTSEAIAPDVERAVMHALEKSPDSRPPTMLDFYRELSGEAVTEHSTLPNFEPPPAGGKRVTEVAPVAVAYATEAAVAAPIPPPPPARARSSGLGRFIALGGLLLGGALVAVAAYQGIGTGSGPGTAPPPPPPRPSTITTVEPLIDTSTIESPMPPPPVTTSSKVPPKHTTTANPPPTAPPPATTTAPPPPPPPTTQPTLPPPPPPTATQPPPPSGLQGDAACSASVNASRALDIERAAGLLRTCQNTGGSGSAVAGARTSIRNQAPAAVKRRAFNGDCAGAKRAADAASSVSAGDRAQATYASTTCAH